MARNSAAAAPASIWPWQLGRARESCGCSWWWWEAIAPCSSLRFATCRTKSTGATTVLLDSISFEYAHKSSSSTSTSFTNSLPHYPIGNPTPPRRAPLHGSTRGRRRGGRGGCGRCRGRAARGWDGEGLVVWAERVKGEPYRSRKNGASRASRRKKKLTTGPPWQ